jgi:hypothetical protein
LRKQCGEINLIPVRNPLSFFFTTAYINLSSIFHFSKEFFLRPEKNYRKHLHLVLSGILTTVLLNTTQLPAKTIKAKSGNRNGIQESINNAPENATIVIPEGEFNFSGPRINIDKSLTITGSGKKKTVLKKSSGLDWFFNVVADGFFRLTNIVLDGGKGGGGVQIRGDNLDFRVDHTTMKNFGTRAIQSWNGSRGVIDNNRFEENRITDIVVYGDNDKSWDKKANLGSADATFIEDNVFEHKTVKNWHSVSSNNGSKYVFRYNTINDGKQNTTPVDAHGNKFFGRGSRTYEIYGNKINSEHSYMGMYIRGGTGVIYDNELTGDFSRPVTLTMESKSNSSYPAQDQIKDLYIWNNRVNGKNATPFVTEGKARECVKENRDYFMKKKAGYTPYPYPHPARNEKRASITSKVKPRISNSLFGSDDGVKNGWSWLLEMLDFGRKG